MDGANKIVPVPKGESCSVCAKGLVQPRRFLLEGVVTFFCKKCTKNAPTVPLGDENTVHIVCKQCSEIFSSANGLSRHVIDQHSAVKPQFPCTKCDKVYTRKDNLSTHIKQKHGDEDTENKFSSDGFFSESAENNGSLVEPDEQPHTSSPMNDATSGHPRKRRAEEQAVTEFEYFWNGYQSGSAQYDADQQIEFNNISMPMTEMQSFCATLVMTLKKMPSKDQIEMKVAITVMLAKKEMEILMRNGAESTVQQSDTATDSTAVAVKREVE